MPLTELDIANMALSHLGAAEINKLTPATTVEARTFNRFYDTCRDKVLSDFEWPFALRRDELLTLVTDYTLDGAVPSGWNYSYRLPVDNMRLVGLAFDSGVHRLYWDGPSHTHDLGSDAVGPLIYADEADLHISYIARVEDPADFTPGFALALSHLLAGTMAPKLTAGDPNNLGQKSLQMYAFLIEQEWKNVQRQRATTIRPEASAMGSESGFEKARS